MDDCPKRLSGVSFWKETSFVSLIGPFLALLTLPFLIRFLVNLGIFLVVGPLLVILGIFLIRHSHFTLYEEDDNDEQIC